MVKYPTRGLLLFLLLISCNKQKVANDNSFDYKSFLLENSGNVPTFDFPLTSTTEEVFNIIDNYTQQDCFDTFKFNFEIGKYRIQCYAEEYCHEFPPSSHPKILSLKLFENEVYLDQEKVNITDIALASEIFFKNRSDIKSHFFIIFISDQKANNIILKESLEDIITGYLKYAEQKFKELHKVEIINADKIKLDDFKSNHTLRLSFNQFSFSIPPPPAPSVEDFK